MIIAAIRVGFFLLIFIAFQELFHSTLIYCFSFSVDGACQGLEGKALRSTMLRQILTLICICNLISYSKGTSKIKEGRLVSVRNVTKLIVITSQNSIILPMVLAVILVIPVHICQV